jgi:hypothetical protein
MGKSVQIANHFWTKIASGGVEMMFYSATTELRPPLSMRRDVGRDTIDLRLQILSTGLFGGLLGVPQLKQLLLTLPAQFHTFEAESLAVVANSAFLHSRVPPTNSET